MNVCDNLGDHLVGNVYVKVRENPVAPLSPLPSDSRVTLAPAVSQGGRCGKSGGRPEQPLVCGPPDLLRAVACDRLP